MNRICVLTIAGSDSGGGAGVQADARTIQALGGYAATAITAVTAQNSRRVAACYPVSGALIAAQIEAVMEDLPVAAAKTGLLPGAASIRAVAKGLARRTRLPLVVDPILGASSGARFLSASAIQALARELMPLATLLTPNWPEAAAMTGLQIRSERQAEAAARRLVAEGWRAVLIKGGHGRGLRVRDCLATEDGRIRWFDGARISTGNTHGTGCVLSAAIALELGRGVALEQAIARARRFLMQSLRRGRGVRLGLRGPAFAG